MTENEGEFKKRIRKTYDKEGFWFAQTPEEMVKSLGIEDAKKEFPLPSEFNGSCVDYSIKITESIKKWFGSAENKP